MKREAIASFYEVRPGLGAIGYLFRFGFITLLSRRSRARPAKMFVQLSSTIDRHILSEGFFEGGVLKALRFIIKRTGCNQLMIDVGANIGNHSIALAPMFKKVEAVEPHPILFRILEANVLLNKLSNVSCHNFGLGGTAGEVTLEESVTEHSISRVAERSVLPPETFGLTSAEFGNKYAVRLEEASRFIGQFSDQLANTFIKIDVEGMEEEIISSVIPIISVHRPIIGFEMFTKAQPKLVGIARSIPGYDLYAVRMHDVGGSKTLRAFKLLFTGRRNSIVKVDPDLLDDVYPLMLLIPSERTHSILGQGSTH